MIPIFNPKTRWYFSFAKVSVIGWQFPISFIQILYVVVKFIPRFVFFTWFFESFYKIIYLLYYFYIFISACYFPISALNSICDYFSSILMSYEGKHASCNNDCHMVVAVGDLEIVKARKNRKWGNVRRKKNFLC